MAELILGSVLDSITGQALSLVSKEIGLARGVKLELDKLRATVSIIDGVLCEAEKRQVKAEDVKKWLQVLKGVVYDANDLLDDYSTEALRRNMVTGRGKRVLNAVRIFFSSSNQLIYASKMAHRVKEIREKIDAISNDRVRFQLEGSSSLIGSSVENRITYPSESKPYVIGRDKDKKEVIRFLLDPHFDENVTILPIVGLGGLGKTTLARLVFNDESVGKHFELKLWACVSTDFIVKDILRELVLERRRSKECDNLDMDELRKKLGEKLGGEKFLIVLDDVWNENRVKWLDLLGLLVNGGKGSKILVTTRTDLVARTMTPKYHQLSGLAEDESLTLLMEMAMKKEHERIELSESRAPEQSFFPSLEEIDLGDLPAFKGWKARRSNEDIQEEEEEEDGSSSLFMYPTFSDKVRVYISGCPRISCMQGRLGHLGVTTTKDLHQLLLKDKDVWHAPHLELPTRVAFFSMSSITLSALTSLAIYEMEEAEHLPMELFQSLPSLQYLEVNDCPRLKSLPVTAMLRYLTSLERLEICCCEELDLSIDIKDGDGGSEEPMQLQARAH